jgi:lipopolysaccharide biosynthesis protein
MPEVVSYQVAAELAKTQPPTAHKRFRCVTTGWDNTPRRGAKGTVFVGSTPAAYERWLTSIIDSFQPYSAEENLVFINAWNEWGEGCHLEPDARWGRGYLEANRRATGGTMRTAVPAVRSAGSRR